MTNSKSFLEYKISLKIIVFAVLIILAAHYIIIPVSDTDNPTSVSDQVVSDTPTTTTSTSQVINAPSDTKHVDMVSCGNGICEPELGEDYKNCGECPEYVVDDFNQITSCGNGICEPESYEVVQNCPEDCQ